MKKFENIQIGKLTTAYGGVGSILETMENGSIMIAPFDHWPFYKNYIFLLIRKRNGQNILPNQEDEQIPVAEDSLLDDKRLIKRLQDKGFIALKEIFMPPVLESNGYSMKGKDDTKLLMAEYFPKWFYCPKCRRFDHINTWRQSWNKKYNYPNEKDVFDKNIPACCDCSTRIGNYRYRRKYLEQVRFVLASINNGSVRDLPWESLIGGGIQQYGQFSEFNIPNQNVLEKSGLKYSTSARTDSLYGIQIKKGNQRMNLGQIDRLHFIDNHNHAYRMYIKNSTNLYFSNTLSSIYIPLFVPTAQEVETLKNIWNNMPDNQKNADGLHGSWMMNAQINNLRQIPFQVIQDLINSDFNIDVLFNYENDDSFLKDEYEFITSEHNYQPDPVFAADDFISEKVALNEEFCNSTK